MKSQLDYEPRDSNLPRLVHSFREINDNSSQIFSEKLLLATALSNLNASMSHVTDSLISGLDARRDGMLPYSVPFAQIFTMIL
jgi:hypothetical protein